MGAKWAPVVSAFHEVATATQVPSNEITAELQKLKAEDPTFTALVGKLERLLTKKQKYASELAGTVNAISANLNTLTSSHAAADALNREISDVSQRTLSHAKVDRVHQMERGARDRLPAIPVQLGESIRI